MDHPRQECTSGRILLSWRLPEVAVTPFATRPDGLSVGIDLSNCRKNAGKALGIRSGSGWLPSFQACSGVVLLPQHGTIRLREPIRVHDDRKPAHSTRRATSISCLADA